MPRHGCESGWHNSLYNNIHPCRLQESDVSRGSFSASGRFADLGTLAACNACAPPPFQADHASSPASDDDSLAVRPSVGLVRHSRRSGAARNARAPPGRS